MILQDTAQGMLAFRQTDHALLSGTFAATWGNDRFPPPPRRDSTLVAASRHDDGWAEWELAPTLSPDGRPVDFIHTPVAEHTALYERGIGSVAAEDAFAGLVVSLHGERLYTRPFVPGGRPRIEHLESEDLELAQRYVAGERERQALLLRAISEQETEAVVADAEEAWRLLQVWDRLSLFVCMRPLEAQEPQQMPAVRGTDGEEVVITVGGGAPGEMLLGPFPFGDKTTFEVEAFELQARTFPHVAAFRKAFRLAPRRIVRFRALEQR